MESLFCFEFNDSYHVKAIVFRALHINHAIDQFVLIFGRDILHNKVSSIKKS